MAEYFDAAPPLIGQQKVWIVRLKAVMNSLAGLAVAFLVGRALFNFGLLPHLLNPIFGR